MVKKRPPVVRERFTLEEILAAVHETRGLITYTAKRLGIDYRTMVAYETRFPEVARAMKDANNAQLDRSEFALFRAIDKGEGWAICFHLKCKGKDRGYVERQEITGRDGAPLTDLSGLTTAQLIAKRESILASRSESSWGTRVAAKLNGNHRNGNGSKP